MSDFQKEGSQGKKYGNEQLMLAKKTQAPIIQTGNGLLRQVTYRPPDINPCFFKVVGWRCGGAFTTAKAYLAECLDCSGM